MKIKVQKNKIRKSRSARTTFVDPKQKNFSHRGNEEAEASTVLCNDCKRVSAAESFITVDDLHMQCPLCLYVFFMDAAQRSALAGAGSAR
jgi:hypothetical protein